MQRVVSVGPALKSPDAEAIRKGMRCVSALFAIATVGMLLFMTVLLVDRLDAPFPTKKGEFRPYYLVDPRTNKITGPFHVIDPKEFLIYSKGLTQDPVQFFATLSCIPAVTGISSVAAYLLSRDDRKAKELPIFDESQLFAQAIPLAPGQMAYVNNRAKDMIDVIFSNDDDGGDIPISIPRSEMGARSGAQWILLQQKIERGSAQQLALPHNALIPTR